MPQSSGRTLRSSRIVSPFLLLLALLCGLSLWNNLRVGTSNISPIEVDESPGSGTTHGNSNHKAESPALVATTTFGNISQKEKGPLLLKNSTNTSTRRFHSIWNYPLESSPSPKSALSSTTADKPFRAIALLSMGPSAAESTLVERCIISIRQRGQFFDPILLLTDSPIERYDSLAREDANLVVMQPRRSDWNWELRRDLPYKRFKTFLLEYLNHRDERLDSIRLVYYLDIDIVIGQPLIDWFHHVEQTHLLSSSKNTVSPSSSSMILFDGNISPLQGGQFLVQKGHSEGCLQRWRFHMDAHPKEHKDQPSLTLMWEEQQKTSASTSNCTLIRMPQEPYLEFLSVKEMSRLKKGGGTGNGNDGYPTLMHIKNTQHASMIPDQLQKEFFQTLLDLPPELVVNITGRRRIRPNRTWSALQVNKKKGSTNG
jgi:hypothetical protein